MYDVKMNQWVRLIIHINFMTFLFYRRDVNSQPVAGLDIEEEDSREDPRGRSGVEEQGSAPSSFLIILYEAA